MGLGASNAAGRVAPLASAPALTEADWPALKREGLPEAVIVPVKDGEPRRVWTRTESGVIERTEPQTGAGARSVVFRAWAPEEPISREVGAIAGGEVREDSPAGQALSALSRRALVTARMTLEMPEGAVRGVVVYVPSLVPEFESAVVQSLRRRGWAVVSTPGTELVLNQSRVRTTWWIGAEADEMAEGSKDASKEDRIQRLTTRAADVTRNLVGLTAEAYRAGLAALERDEPGIQGRPVIVAGFSLGAIMAPGVVERLAERLGDRLCGVVLVGGGADIAGILRDSALTDLRESLDWGLGTIEEIDDERFERLRAEYLAKARLDPYALAPGVGRFPTLMLHARGDGIVPARYGELLWERLGKPERWSWGYGHQLLFWRLDGYAERIGEWMEERADVRSGG
jgi:hypothetical protein